tara:strand:- start:156366 stop:156866 length:501 start_codon:yes stop_codon:yes gene_type:complete
MDLDEIKKIMKKEGDYFEFYAYNLKCYGKRGPVSSWCGYVEVPKIHGFFNADVHILDVHGGVTWDAFSSDRETLTIGFDCAHSGDIVPDLLVFTGVMNFGYESTYRDKEYVKNEIENMARQIHEHSPEYYDLLTLALKNINKNMKKNKPLPDVGSVEYWKNKNKGK